jgi:hypothetical protein
VSREYTSITAVNPDDQHSRVILDIILYSLRQLRYGYGRKVGHALQPNALFHPTVTEFPCPVHNPSIPHQSGLMATHQTETGPRIPVELQDVFLASNRGEDVAVAPPNKMATKLFGRFGLTRRSSRLLARGRATSTRSSAVVLLGWPSSSLRAKQVLGEPTSSVPVSPEPPTDRSAGDHQHSTSNNGEKPTTANAVPTAERCQTTRSNAVAQNNLRSTSDHSMSSPTRTGPGERVSARTGR